MEKNIETKELLAILFIGLLLRSFSIYLFSDEVLTNEWAVIIKNYKLSGTFGVNVVQNEFFAFPNIAKEGEKVLPTIFMPPLYYYFIYLVDLIFNDYLNIANYIIILQTLLSLISIILFYKIIQNFEKDKFITLLVTSIFAFFL